MDRRMTKTTKPEIFFIDLETTGLDPATCVIVEVGFKDPSGPAPPLSYTVGSTKEDWAAANEFVNNMHSISGLKQRSLDCAFTIEEVDRWVSRYIQAGYSSIDKPLLGGNSVQFDQAFIRAHMPLTAKALHPYRIFDVTTISTLAQLGGMSPYQKAKKHTAREDLEETLGELDACIEFLESDASDIVYE